MSSTQTPPRLFGTDGIRGRAGEGMLTPDSVSALGRALGRVVREALLDRAPDPGTARVLLGHDGRRSGPELEHALARGLRDTGFEPESTGLITTPGLAGLTGRGPFAVGAMISASHNAASDNGIKLFDGAGDKLSDELERAVEKRFFEDREPVLEGAPPALHPEHEEAYLQHLLLSAEGLRLDGMCIALDCAHGGGSRIGPRVLGLLGAQVITIGCEPDGANINQGFGSTQPKALQELVRVHGADIGIALDGDGDRCILVDQHGALVDGDGILTVIARHAAAHGKLAQNRIVATVMSNKGLHKALREVGVAIETVSVGDRNVVEALRRHDLALGGEQSGHIVFGASNDFIGDGLLTALRVLQVLRAEQRGLTELAAPYRKFPQELINIPVARKPPLTELGELQREVRRIEDELGDNGRVLLRYSGTERLARVMVEGPDADDVRTKANGLAEIVRRELG